MKKPTKQETRRADAEHDTFMLLTRLELEIAEYQRSNKLRDAIPEGWHRVDRDHPTRPRKVQITLRLDQDVAGWFWQQGQGYQTRINAVLRAFMLAKRAEVV